MNGCAPTTQTQTTFRAKAGLQSRGAGPALSSLLGVPEWTDRESGPEEL